MKKSIIWLSLSIIFILNACQSNTSTSGLWMLMNNTSAIPSIFKTASDTAEMNIAGSFIQLENNGDFNARIFSMYLEGDWTMKSDSVLQLTSLTHDTLQFYIKHAQPDSLIFSLFYSSKESLNQTFTLGATQNTKKYKEEENPYSRDNNNWALKPTKKQTDIEIRQKVLNYINYLILVLNDPYNNSDYIDQIDNPIRIANNGLSLRFKEYVDENYIQTYYDRADFETGFRMLDGAFRCSLYPMDTDDFTKLDTDLLKQIYKIIKEVQERK